MAFDLAAAKTRLNITGTTQDAVVQAALDASVSVCENYCKRKFMQASETNTFHWVDGVTLQFERFPINNVLAMRDTGKGTAASSLTNSKYYEVYNSAGQIRFNGHNFSKSLEVDTDAGYAVLPDDLELALWMVFDNVYNSMSNPGGGAASSGGIKSVSLVGVGTVNYDTNSSASAAAAASKPGAGGFIPLGALNLLDNYVLHVA